MFIGNDNPVKKRFSIFIPVFIKIASGPFAQMFLSSHSGVVEIQNRLRSKNIQQIPCERARK